MSHDSLVESARIVERRAVRRIDHVWIPLSGGLRLAARIWLPVDASARPVPAVLEYIPYRKNDNTAVDDEGRHAYFAEHGYASVRIDMRGSGDSDGVLLDEYLEQEQDDAVEAIGWIADQPWCTGAVGMIGYSWGGFAALQVAARRPDALRAIVTVDSTDDRYADDVHYMGGCVLGYFMLSWAASMHVFATLPPDPHVVGDAWREMWLHRLRAAHPMVEPWLTHQLRDDYWRHGSVCEDFARITCPVYAFSGWADGYRGAVLRLMEGLNCPRKAVIGPWSHTYPVEAQPPGPAVGFLQECIRWWDQWLKDEDTGIMAEPALRLWIQDEVPPAPLYWERPGRWVGEGAWPAPGVEQRQLFLDEHVLSDSPRPAVEIHHVGAQEHGIDAGNWDPYGEPADLPPDQRAEDGRAIAFTSGPLDESLDIVGVPVARLTLRSDRERALVSVRLCDVDEDGRSCLITRGLLNLTHRGGHDEAVALVPGEPFTVDVAMKAIGQRVPAGHRLRLSVSTTYWPWAWPSPDPVRLSLICGESALLLPVRHSQPDDGLLPQFGPPELAPRPGVEMLELRPGDHTTRRSIGNGTFELTHTYPHERFLISDSGIEVERYECDRFTITEDDPLSAHVRSDRRFGLCRGDWRITVESESEMSCDRDVFRVWTSLRALDGCACVFSQTWSFTIPRLLV